MPVADSVPEAAVPTGANIFDAALDSGPSGTVIARTEIDFNTAVSLRKAGKDIVVCGDNLNANRDLAKAVEAAVGPYQQERFHRRAGPMALPHFHQRSRVPEGHSFYETEKRKARKGT